MNGTALSIALLLASGIRISTPFILGTLGETLTERSGHLNLGVEGMMMLGAAMSYIVSVYTQNVILAFLGGMIGAMFGALIYAFLTVSLRTNQTVTGLALTMFGVGLGNTIGKLGKGAGVPETVSQWFAHTPLALPDGFGEGIPVLGSLLRFINAAFLNHNIFVYFTLVLAVLMAIILFKTSIGLNVRAVGESPAAADASGMNVNRIKYLSILIGGAFAGLAGAYYPLVHIGTWTDNITGGRGWIIVALVIFVRWHPIKAIFGSFLFGVLDVIGLRIATLIPAVASWPIFSEYAFNMYPYIMTIIVLIISYIRGKKGWMGPAALGKPYFREER